MKQEVRIARSQFSEKFLYLNGQPFSLTDYPHMVDIYNTTAREVVMKFSRQTAKSTTLANIIISNAAMIPHFKTLFVSPRVDQAKVFSHDRVAPVIEGSPLIKEHYVNSSLVQNVFMKQFLNGSKIYIRYALLNADAIRGYSADMNIFDEVQDLVADHIPIIQETMSRSMYKKSWYAGTPKRSRGTLADIWFRSTMNEFAIQCEICNHWNILSEDNIGLHGVICAHCGKPLNLKNGQWVSTYSETQNPSTEGFRVCALHFASAPWVNWEMDILQKRDNSPSKAIFYNETLALEYDEGVAPITKLQLQSCCDNNMIITPEPDDIAKAYVGVLGVDYGPTNSEKSNTIAVVAQKRGDKYYIPYMKKFKGKEANYTYIHKEIPHLKSVWNCSLVAADYGMGEASNAEIRNRIGYDKLIAFQHTRTQKEKVRFNEKIPAYTLSRTGIMTDMFDMIKQGKIVFPRWEYFEPFADDILNIQIETDEDLGTTKYVNVGPDDFFHALTYAIVSILLMEGYSL